MAGENGAEKMNDEFPPRKKSKMNPSTKQNLSAACRRIPPLWPLKNFVAVNPFVGLSDRHFVEAAQLIQKTGHGEMLMPAGYYRQKIARGLIAEGDFQRALEVAKQTLPPEWAEKKSFQNLEDLSAALDRPGDENSPGRVLTFADFLDAKHQTGWAAFVVEEMSKWCSAYFDQGQSSWRMPWRQLGLFAAWKSAAKMDANPELMGLKKFRAFVAALPDDHSEIIHHALDKLGVGDSAGADFLHRQLMSLPGWSSHVQYLVRRKSMAGENDNSLEQLLAIRLVYDLALLSQFGNDAKGFRERLQFSESMNESFAEKSRHLLARFVAQQALECGYQNELIARLKKRSPQPIAGAQKSLQAIFCIDVRSEIIRRALEAQSAQIETIGFAGFFGMAIEYVKFGQSAGTSQCPVLLTPKFKVCEALRHAADEPRLLRRMKFWQTVNGAWNAFKTSAISCFSFVETAGLWFGVKLAKDSLAPGPAEISFTQARQKLFPKIEREVCCAATHGQDADTGIAPADQLALAAGALKGMGLVADFAKIVLICGHGSATTNNPYGSALDCGACGGHAGDTNARVAAAILNQPAVRAGLKAKGIEIPAETVFIAGLHNTTTDEIVIYQEGELSPNQSAELDEIKGWLSSASEQARRERAASLGLVEMADEKLDKKVYVRSRDWSQVRPEWGLAGNAAFIAAPRERTKGLALGGRTFLHNYSARLDQDKSTLEMILTAPMVVASWINLQYYGSTVDNRLFGSGNKVLHNVVGVLGVWQGNGGDLQSGLPLQSIHDGARLMHEPLRLSVFVEAARADIEKILAKHAGVRELCQNGWVHLLAMENEGKEIYPFVGNSFSQKSL